MSGITTHILDVARGRPAPGVEVTLEIADGSDGQSRWSLVGSGHTDDDGRASGLVADSATLLPGVYRLIFNIGAYFAVDDIDTFYPRAVIEFHVKDPSQHYHVPLLLSPFGYTTYRGS